MASHRIGIVLLALVLAMPAWAQQPVQDALRVSSAAGTPAMDGNAFCSQPWLDGDGAASRPLLLSQVRNLDSFTRTHGTLPLRALNLENLGAGSWPSGLRQTFQIAVPAAQDVPLRLIPLLVAPEFERAPDRPPVTADRARLLRSIAMTEERVAQPGQTPPSQRRISLELEMPTLPMGWGDIVSTPATVSVIACDATDKLLFIAQRSADLSSRAHCILFTALAVALAWLAVGHWAPSSRRVREYARTKGGNRGRWASYLDPVIITQDELGYGSLHRLQVFYFTFLIASLLVYIILRAGFLSDIPEQLLYLMGVAAIGSASASLIDKRNRGDATTGEPREGPKEITLNFLLDSGILSERERFGNWSDIFSEGRNLGIHRVQVIIFSALVGMWLLRSGFAELASFKLPDNILALLGVSQAVYVAGKAIMEPPSWKDLNQKVDALEADIFRQNLDAGITLDRTKIIELEAAARLALRESRQFDAAQFAATRRFSKVELTAPV